ncbi:hypothetical protein HYALB_00010321 [Hymenoscyphus albidus]|uniref:RNA-dependent RNA polymerase n=1 Tax=Hymenoscyphus albidus TaxID=595503 RepID=A0A9N9LID8_9HELO|nr:hypothetical protein HYALB_00010321 [Hymenoscyphus albidus]
MSEFEEQIAKHGLYLEESTEASKTVAIIHKARVTAAGISLWGPEAENNNRVLRKYSGHHEFFLRVQFSDEDGNRLAFSKNTSNKPIFDRFQKILDDGISIAGRQFSFLGFSHSSLRSQSCWFMAPFAHEGSLLYYKQVISGLGDFKNIRIPARCAARIGQAFSDTRDAIRLPLDIKREIPDVERNGRTFSDGCGIVSRQALYLIWAGLPPGKSPTVLQLRYQAAYKPITLYLNEQLIPILEVLGIENKWFLDLQRTEIERLYSTTLTANNASQFLSSHSIGDKIGLPRFLKVLVNYRVSFQEDDFLTRVVETAVLIQLRTLKYKARIPVRKGFTLLGIMDETGILEEGQVFCIADIDGVSKVITGEAGRPIIISRSPALHPGG